MRTEKSNFEQIIKMKHVSLQSIEKAIKKVDNLNDEGLERIAETYALAQQTLLGYVLSAAEEYQNPQLEGLLIYYFCLISEAFSQEQIKLKEIDEQNIEEFEEPFFEILGAFFDQDDEDILHNYVDQPELTRFMMVEVSTEDNDGSSLDDETATQLFIVTTAMITLMGKATNET